MRLAVDVLGIGALGATSARGTPLGGGLYALPYARTYSLGAPSAPGILT